MVATMPTEWEVNKRVGDVLREQGRTISWLGRQIGKDRKVMWRAFSGAPYYRFTHAQKHRIAELLGIPPWVLWGDYAPKPTDAIEALQIQARKMRDADISNVSQQKRGENREVGPNGGTSVS